MIRLAFFQVLLASKSSFPGIGRPLRGPLVGRIPQSGLAWTGIILGSRDQSIRLDNVMVDGSHM